MKGQIHSRIKYAEAIPEGITKAKRNQNKTDIFSMIDIVSVKLLNNNNDVCRQFCKRINHF